MFGQDWQQHVSSQAQARGASGDFWLGQLTQLPTVEASPLPSSAAKLGTWGQFASSGRIGNGVGQILEANYRATGTLYNRIGEGLGWVRGPWLETLGPLAEAGSWSEWATIPTNFASGKTFSAIAPLAKSALSGQFGGLSDEQMFRLVVSTTLNVIDLVATVVPAAGPVVDLVTDLAEIGLLQGMDGEPADPRPCGEDYRAAEASAEADTAATNKILDLLKNRPDQQAPDLTPLFFPPAPRVQVESVRYGAGPISTTDDRCGRGYGAFSDRQAKYQRPGDDMALGYIPGAGIHQGLQRMGAPGASYDWSSPWTEIGNYLPTANCVMNRLWIAMQQRGPLMFSVDAWAARAAWVEYIASWFTMMTTTFSWNRIEQVQGVWDQWSTYVGNWPKFASVWGSNRISLDSFYGRRRKDGSSVDFEEEAARSQVCADLARLTGAQSRALETRWAAYIDFGFPGVQSLTNGASRWYDTVQGLATSPVRGILDAQNIRLPELRQAVEQAQASKAIGGLVSTDGILDPGNEELEENPVQVWPTVALPPGVNRRPGFASLALLGAAGLLARRFLAGK